MGWERMGRALYLGGCCVTWTRVYLDHWTLNCVPFWVWAPVLLWVSRVLLWYR